jgi:hypothetical protein
MSLTLRAMRPVAVKRWHYAVFKTAAAASQERLDEGLQSGWDEYNILWLKWRVAFNLYKDGRDLLQAWTILEELCREENASYFLTEYVSAFNLCMGKVCLELYYETRDRNYLNYSYFYNQRGVETMRYDLYAMFKLPEVLQYFGRVMEHYGAFDASMEVYNKVLTNYPNYKGYFHVIYRTAIVGKYIAEYSDAQKRESFIEQCCDTVGFLLEALPVGLDDVHVVLVYALCLEFSSNASNRFRASGIYHSLFDVCARRNPPLAHAGVASRGMNDFKTWSEDAQTWRLLGEYFLEMQEELTARDCFRKFTDRVNFNKNKNLEYFEEQGMTVDMLLRIAKNSASIQNYPDAASFAVMALGQNHFHRETRRLLAQWSPHHAKKLLKEELAVLVLEQTWRQRWFLPGYKKRYHQIVVEQYEKLLANDYMNVDVREKLSYFARDKWRPQFLFENECAKRIQAKIRNCFIIWKWQQPLRARHAARASECYRKYNKKKYDRKVRAEMYALASHRFLPKKHVAAKLVPLFALQEKSRVTIWKCFKAFKFRSTLRRMVNDTAHRKLMTAALMIQAIVRMMNGKLYVKRMKELLALQNASAAKIQKAFRGRFSSMRYTTNMRVAKKKREEEREMMRINFLLSKLWAEKQSLKKQNDAQRRITLAYRVYQRFKHVLRNKHNYAARIQRAFRNYKMSGLVGLTRYLIRNRQFIQFSDSSHRTLDSLLHGDQMQVKGKPIDREAYLYKSPGFRQGTPEYNRTLNQQVICCNRSFSSHDCVLLGSVLRNPLCRTRKLVFLYVNAKGSNWEFDMIPAIGRCRSLRSVSIFGGVWPGAVVQKILHEIEIENPMIQTFHVESVGEWKREVISEVNACTSKLLQNFFNYSVPGIHTLSLHGLGLIDEDIEVLARGLEVNTSLQSMCLSLNMIEDKGLGFIVKALSANRKSILKSVNISWNMLTLGDSVSSIISLRHALYRF